MNMITSHKLTQNIFLLTSKIPLHSAAMFFYAYLSNKTILIYIYIYINFILYKDTNLFKIKCTANITGLKGIITYSDRYLYRFQIKWSIKSIQILCTNCTQFKAGFIL